MAEAFAVETKTISSTATGHLSNVGDVINLSGPNDIRNFRAIRAGATDAKVQVSYER